MSAKVWIYPGMTGWHFVTLPREKAAIIKSRFGKSAKGWGSLPVSVTIGKTNWKTSIFPEKRSGSYLLPLKAEVRKKESVWSGKVIKFSIELK